MIRFKYIKDAAGVPSGTIKEWDDNHAGLVRALIAEGVVEKLADEPIREKIEKLPQKKVEKIETTQPPKKLKK